MDQRTRDLIHHLNMNHEYAAIDYIRWADKQITTLTAQLATHTTNNGGAHN